MQKLTNWLTTTFGTPKHGLATYLDSMSVQAHFGSRAIKDFGHFVPGGWGSIGAAPIVAIADYSSQGLVALAERVRGGEPISVVNQQVIDLHAKIEKYGDKIQNWMTPEREGQIRQAVDFVGQRYFPSYMPAPA